MFEFIFRIVVISNNLFALSEFSYHCFLLELSEMPRPLVNLKSIVDLLIYAFIACVFSSIGMLDYFQSVQIWKYLFTIWATVMRGISSVKDLSYQWRIIAGDTLQKREISL